MEKYRKCDGCGLTFRDPGNRDWTWQTKDYQGTHWFCGNECLSRWNHEQKIRKEKKQQRGWRR